MYALLTKREVKMAGFWPSSFFFCDFMDRVEVDKTKRGQHPAILTEQTCSIKDSLYRQKENVFLWDRRVCPPTKMASKTLKKSITFQKSSKQL